MLALHFTSQSGEEMLTDLQSFQTSKQKVNVSCFKLFSRDHNFQPTN
jgi:hypothetical protein